MTAIELPARTAARRPVVLVLLGVFWPGNDATGPVQSFLALAASLQDTFDFKVVARDRPSDGGRPLAPRGQWHDLGVAHVCYCPPSLFASWFELKRLLRNTPHDVLVMNSFFARDFTVPALLLRRLDLVPLQPAILSPCGEFSPGALGLKSARKRTYLAFAKGLGLMEGLVFQATSTDEANDIGRACPCARKIVVAPAARALRPLPPRARDEAGPVRLVFLSRIDRMKNLDFALAALAGLRSPAHFDIIGPVTDDAYWRDCQKQMAALPAHITVRYRGAVPNERVLATVADYDLFVLPTRGENFCHAIFDALEAGTPVLVSDRTPWRNLDRFNAGWDFPLDDPRTFTAAIERLATMDARERAQLRRGARALAEHRVAEDDATARNRDMLRFVAGTTSERLRAQSPTADSACQL